MSDNNKPQQPTTETQPLVNKVQVILTLTSSGGRENLEIQGPLEQYTLMLGILGRATQMTHDYQKERKEKQKTGIVIPIPALKGPGRGM